VAKYRAAVLNFIPARAKSINSRGSASGLDFDAFRAERRALGFKYVANTALAALDIEIVNSRVSRLFAGES
jgi:hypothetical protein